MPPTSRRRARASTSPGAGRAGAGGDRLGGDNGAVRAFADWGLEDTLRLAGDTRTPRWPFGRVTDINGPGSMSRAMIWRVPRRGAAADAATRPDAVVIAGLLGVAPDDRGALIAGCVRMTCRSGWIPVARR